MTGKERVKRAIHFDGPDKMPVMLLDGLENDLITLWPFPRSDKAVPWHLVKPADNPDGEVWETVNVWGSTIRRFGRDGNGEVVHPALENAADLADYVIPDMFGADAYPDAKEQLERNKDKYIVCVMANGSLFETAHHLRRLDNLLTDFYLERDAVTELLDRLKSTVLTSIDTAVALGADGVMGYDDWGMQDRPMIGMELWNEFFRPRYKECWDYAHSKGLDVWMHSCGYTLPVLEQWQRIGLNVAQLDQQENMGLDMLSQRLGGKLAFWCPVDIQTVMINGSPDEVRAYVQRMFAALGGFKGGLIGKTYPSPDVVRHSRENLDAMHDEMRNHCRYD